MKSTYFIYFFILLMSLQSSAQNSDLPFSSIDMQAMCKSLGTEKRIVGLGESTHGTKEFTTIRSEIVKELVTVYNYRALVLEAEYAPATKINEYILTGKGDIERLLTNLRLWPWIHEDFLALLRWLRSYNELHPTSQVQFYGMDSQYSGLYAKKDSILLYYPEIGKTMFEIIESTGKPKEKIESLQLLSTKMSENAKSIDLQLQYFILCHINKLSKLVKQNYNIRDENMAHFVQLLQKKNNDTLKMVLWGHNDHISKRGASLNERTALGHYLSLEYANEYSSVGLDFKEGVFMAVDSEKMKERKIESFNLSPTKETLASTIDFREKDFVIVNCKSLRKSFFVNAIGAVYVMKPDSRNSFYSKITKDEQYDYLIISQKSTCINLLPMYLNN